MSEQRARATLVHSPDLNLSPYNEDLERLQIAPRPASDGEPPPLQSPTIFLITPSWWNGLPAPARARYLELLTRQSAVALVAGERGEDVPLELEESSAMQWVDLPLSAQALRTSIRSGVQQIATALQLADAQVQLSERDRQMQEVYRVGIALSAERDLDALQNFILGKAREMTCADAGTLYVLEENADKQRVMLFNASQCDSIDAPYTRLVLPLNTRSVAGFSASTGQVLRLDDVYKIDERADYAFSPAFDQKFGYLTRSMLIVPMRNHLGEVVGVIQLINKKRHFESKLTGPDVVDAEVTPFTSENEQMLLSFASQAAVAIENRMLLESIKNLFDGFVRASVTAIELRDPSTFGHSDRVSQLTVGLARAVNDIQAGRWKDVRFTEQQLTELEYAGLLHDFGKVGVREHVLVKAKKLYDWTLETIRARFRLARRMIEQKYDRKKLELAVAHPERYGSRAGELDQECRRELDELDAAWKIVLQSNEPSILAQECASQLKDIAARRVLLGDDETVNLLLDDELHSLTIPKGTLDEQERLEIESHVTKSFNFLMKIPWTSELQGIPQIAYAHHEKLSGHGYPRKLSGEQIPIQARMMTIADIFDALTAQDRPYKPAVPLQRALDILGMEVRDGNLDGELLDLFIHRRLHEMIFQIGK